MDKIDYTAMKFWLDVVQWVVTLLVALWVWMDRRRRDNTDKIEELKNQQQKTEHRLTAVEEYMRHAPTHEDIAKLHELQLEISELRGDLKELRPQLQQVKHLSGLLLENELKESKS